MPLRFVATPFFHPASEELRYLPEAPRVLRQRVGGVQVGWVAIQHGKDSSRGSFNILDLKTCENKTLPLPGRPGFFAETSDPDVILVGLEHELALFHTVTGAMVEVVTRIDAPADVIINDGLAVEGGVLFGTKHLEFNRPVAALYFFDAATRTTHLVLDGQTCSNGKLLRRDREGATLIDIDTTPKRITRYRLDAALKRVLEARLIKPPESLPALPDGLRAGPDDSSVIIAFYNPADVAEGVAQQIRVADGEVLCEWVVPGAPRVTCPEFVRFDGKVKLLLTTAVEGMSKPVLERAPGSGSLYLADTPFEDVPAPPPLLAIG